jgi:hypothetical protein
MTKEIYSDGTYLANVTAHPLLNGLADGTVLVG